MVQKIYNLKKLDEIAQDNKEFVRDMVVTFVDNVTTEIVGIQSFRSSENWIAVAESTHKLTSNFAYLGASSLQTLAADIEKSVINDRNLTGIADKTEKLCNESLFLIIQLKKDFCIIDTN